MSDSLKDLLKSYKADEPPEIEIIKSFVLAKFNAQVQIGIQDQQLIITVPGASLANALRLEMPALKTILKTNKNLIIRIG
jgi:hypothetical protein